MTLLIKALEQVYGPVPANPEKELTSSGDTLNTSEKSGDSDSFTLSSELSPEASESCTKVVYRDSKTKVHSIKPVSIEDSQDNVKITVVHGQLGHKVKDSSDTEHLPQSLSSQAISKCNFDIGTVDFEDVLRTDTNGDVEGLLNDTDSFMSDIPLTDVNSQKGDEKGDNDKSTRQFNSVNITEHSRVNNNQNETVLESNQNGILDENHIAKANLDRGNQNLSRVRGREEDRTVNENGSASIDPLCWSKGKLFGVNLFYSKINFHNYYVGQE